MPHPQKNSNVVPKEMASQRIDCMKVSCRHCGSRPEVPAASASAKTRCNFAARCDLDHLRQRVVATDDRYCEQLTDPSPKSCR
jgi:hypothetical protein